MKGRHQATEWFHLLDHWNFLVNQQQVNVVFSTFTLGFFNPHFNCFSFLPLYSHILCPPTSASAQLDVTFVHFLVSYLEVFHSSSCPPPFLCTPEAPFHTFPSFFMLLMLSPPDFSTDVCFKWFSWFSPNVSVSFCCHIFLEAVLHKTKVRKKLLSRSREEVAWLELQQKRGFSGDSCNRFVEQT